MLSYIAPILLSVGWATAGAGSVVDIDFCLTQYVENRKACGPISAWYSLKALGHDVTLSEVRERVVLNDDGVAVADILEVLRSYEPQTAAIEGSASRLELLPTPSILIIGDSHCVTLLSVDRQRSIARIFEPSICRLQDQPLDAIRSQWSGKALVFSEPLPSQSSLFLIAALSAIAIVLPGYWILRRTL